MRPMRGMEVLDNRRFAQRLTAVRIVHAWQMSTCIVSSTIRNKEHAERRRTSRGREALDKGDVGEVRRLEVRLVVNTVDQGRCRDEAARPEVAATHQIPRIEHGRNMSEERGSGTAGCGRGWTHRLPIYRDQMPCGAVAVCYTIRKCSLCAIA